jgi:hypothetical protein
LIISQQATVTTYNNTFTTGSGTHAWQIGNAEQMRLTSTGLGIGTSSPAYKLDVRGGVVVAGNGTIVGGISYSTRPEIGAISNHPVGFITNNTTQMLLDTSGNLGIGTSSPGAKLDVVGIVQSNNGFQVTGGSTTINTGMWGTAGVLAFNTGNTERARIDSSGNLGIGTSTVAGKLQISNGASTAVGLTFGPVAVTGDYAQIVWTPTSGSQNLNFSIDGGFFKWARLGSEQMRLDASGNLGIGTISPQARLEVSGAGNLYINQDQRLEWNIAGSNTIRANIRGTSGNALVFGNRVGGVLTDTMTLDGSGNLGLGVTPSAWSTADSVRALQLNGGSFYVFGANRCFVGQNVFLASGGIETYATTAAASTYRQFQGAHSWYNSTGVPSAGGPISFTQALTLTATGNLLVGLTSDTASARAVVGGTVISTTNTVSTFSGDYAGFDRTSSKNMRLFAGTSDATGSSIEFYTGVSGGISERARITSGGDLLVGATSAVARISVENSSAGDGITVRSNGINTNKAGTTNALLLGCDYTTATSYVVAGGSSTNTTLAFYTAAAAAPVERARITSGGYFKASNTGTYTGSTASYHEFYSTGNTWTQYNANSNAAPSGIVMSYNAAAPNGTGNQFLFCGDNAVTRAEIRSNGGIANYQANDVNLSDRREKTNFAPAKSYIDTICAIPVQTFNYIDQSADDPGLTLGVVAQDVQAVAPELVMESNWGTEDNPKMRLSIYQTDLQYALMKCIQEQQALINDLRARVAQLEAQP